MDGWIDKGPQTYLPLWFRRGTAAGRPRWSSRWHGYPTSPAMTRKGSWGRFGRMFEKLLKLLVQVLAPRSDMKVERKVDVGRPMLELSSFYEML